MPFVATFLALSVLGAINAGYLFSTHQKGEKLVCPLDHDCSVVTESRWSRVLGVRNELLGLLFFIGLFVCALLFLAYPAWESLLRWLLLFATLGGFLYSLFLVLLQAIVIKDYCFYCIISALISTLLFINSFALLS